MQTSRNLSDNPLKQTKFHGAVVGNDGSGKSTFINNFLGLNFDDEGAAETGVVEITREITEYFNPKNPSVSLTEIPEKFPVENKYDFFIILSHTRFTQVDTKLVNTIKEFNKPYFFLRTKVDDSIRNAKRRKVSESDSKEQIINDCIENLGIENKDKIFLVGYANIDSDKLGYSYNEFLNTLNNILV